MTFDRDLQIARRVFSGFTAANLAVTVMNFWVRNWMMALTGIVWTLCCAAMVWFARLQQTTRDQSRLTEAAVNALIERNESR